MAALPSQIMGVIQNIWEREGKECKGKTDTLVEINFLGLLAMSGQG